MSSRVFKAFLAGSVSCALAFLISSCKKEENPIVPSDPRPLITAQDFRKLVLTMTDYDIVRVTHQLGIELRSRNVVRIGVGTKDTTGYAELLVDSTRYDASAQAYIIHFGYTVRMDSSKSDVNLTVRYYLTDSSFSDADTSVALYKYPYQSAEVFLHYPPSYPGASSVLPLQDIARTDSLFLFHPLGPEGLYVYNLVTGHFIEAVPYVAGDHIAASSRWAYYEDRNRGFGRLDLQTLRDSVLIPSHTRVIGMDVFGGWLYVWYARSNGVLVRCALDGTPLDSLPLPVNRFFYMTIHDSVVYTVNYGVQPATLSRFNLRTRSFMPDVLAPSRDIDGIKAFGNQLYFTDYDKDHVGVMPIADLRTPN